MPTTPRTRAAAAIAALAAGPLIGSGGAAQAAQTGCNAPATHQIAQVQGPGDTTPLEGRTVRVEGVVTGDFQRGDQLGGFFIQDPTPDGDPATSEGLFVFAGASFKDVEAGDRVLVTGRATEYHGLTELSAVSAVDVCGTGTITPARLQLPHREGASLEPYEGMLVTFPQPLTATEHYRLGRCGELTVSAGGRLFQPTDRPGVSQEDNDRRRLLIDDGSTRQNPPNVPFLSPRPVRLGDTVRGLTGVLDHRFDSYRLQPTRQVTFQRTNPRPARPRPVGPANVTVASFNTLNWFTTLNRRGADTPQEQERQLTKLVAALKGLNADVVGLMEVENNDDTAVKALVDRLNAELGANVYSWVRHPSPGSDEIQVSLIYKPGKVTPVGAPRSSTDEDFDRPPLAQTFRRVAGGEPFTVIVNHFKSKGCDGATGEEADQGDGQGCWNPKRVRQARAVAALAAKTPHPLVIGDLNAYGAEDPIKTLQAAGFTGRTQRFVPAHDRYSYVFDGQSGELDHMLASRSLARRVTGAAIWHINADEPLILDYNTEYNPPSLYAPDAYRSSDHDPVIVGLRLHGGR